MAAMDRALAVVESGFGLNDVFCAGGGSQLLRCGVTGRHGQ
jgi:hypothetical protein